MPHAHITINGTTVLNKHVNQGQTTNPLEIAKYLKPGTPPQPGIVALFIEFGNAVKTDQDITINLRNRPHGYELTVDYARVIEAVAQ